MASDKDKVEASCVPCQRDHLITVKSMLNEAVRMSHTRPISDPEIQFRINKAEEEIDAMERGDLTPTKIAALPSDEKKIVEDIASRARSEIRHQLESTGIRWGQGNREDLERIAVSAEKIEKDFRERMTPIIAKKHKSYLEVLDRGEEIIKRDKEEVAVRRSHPIMNSFKNIPKPWDVFEELRPRKYFEILRRTAAAEGNKKRGKFQGTG